uniref:MULE domain-containing protein n=1 Tax=Globodera pallida TaxID=36090 RepID=A0A183C6Z6_GLOPA
YITRLVEKDKKDFWSTVVSRLGIGDEEHQLRRHTPAPFTQVYVILARRDKWVFPVCHCLLTAKTQATYERMFDLLQQCWPMFKPRVASIDFEQAMVGALHAKHPQCDVNFCLFHLVRNMKKRVAEQGLTHLYNTDASFSQAARMITTNNYAESYNRTLQHAFGHTHPKIWTFIDKLREQQKMFDVNMEHFIAGNDPPPKQRSFATLIGGFCQSFSGT